MKTRTEKVISGIVVLGLIVFFVVPIVYVNYGNQAFIFGKPISPAPSGMCAMFGCHCASQESLSAWFLGIGFGYLIDGCP